MCGIAGIYIKDPNDAKDTKAMSQMNRMLDELLLNIENRGTHATGFLSLKPTKEFELDKSPIRASEFIKIRKQIPKGATVALGHTRLATQGSPKNWLNNHPVIYKGTFVTHNGVISNDDQIFRDEKLERFGEVDTEAIAAILHKTGLDDPAKGLEKLRGGFACAAINIEKPTELILFKGGLSYPLVYHDNKKFVIWASTGNAIKEAWAKVLGTPPAWVNLHHLTDGDLLRINGDEVELTAKAFRHSTASFGGYGKSHWYSDWDDSTSEDWSDVETCESPYLIDRKPTTDYSSRVTNALGIRTPQPNNLTPSMKVCELAVAQTRKNGAGKALIWAERGKLSKKELDKHREKDGGPFRWDHCMSCKVTVARNDMREGSLWGTICVDCQEFLMRMTVSTELDNAYTNLEVIDGIEEWVQLEAYIHHNTLLRVENVTGMTIHAVDYLLFRTTEDYKKRKEIGLLVDDLKEKYDKENGIVWELYAAQFEEDEGDKEEKNVQISKSTEIAEFPSAWVTCGAGLHKITEDCESCGKGEKTETKPLPTRVSRRNTSTSSKPSVLDPIKKRDGLCLLCIRKAKVYITPDFRWCTMHYNKCGYKDCKTIGDEERNRKPVGWNKEGVRFCHLHFRGTKNGMLDNNVRQTIAASK